VQRFVGGAHIARWNSAWALSHSASAPPPAAYARANRAAASRGDRRGGTNHRCERGIGPLLDGEHLLVRHERILLTEHHLPGFAQEHPGVRIRGEALRRFLRRCHCAPAVFDRRRNRRARDGFRERRR